MARLFLLALVPIIVGQDIVDDVIECCHKGKQWAVDQRGSCDDFPVPVPEIPVESQVRCNKGNYKMMKKYCNGSGGGGGRQEQEAGGSVQ